MLTAISFGANLTPIATKCTLQWIAHYCRTEGLKLNEGTKAGYKICRTKYIHLIAENTNKYIQCMFHGHIFRNLYEFYLGTKMCSLYYRFCMEQKAPLPTLACVCGPCFIFHQFGLSSTRNKIKLTICHMPANRCTYTYSYTDRAQALTANSTRIAYQRKVLPAMY